MAVFEGRRMERWPISEIRDSQASSRLYELLSGEGGPGKGGQAGA